MHLDAFECLRMPSDAFGCLQMLSDAGRFGANRQRPPAFSNKMSAKRIRLMNSGEIINKTSLIVFSRCRAAATGERAKRLRTRE